MYEITDISLWQSLLINGFASLVSVACGQPQSENIKWKIPEIIHHQTFQLHAVLSSVMKSHMILPRM